MAASQFANDLRQSLNLADPGFMLGIAVREQLATHLAIDPAIARVHTGPDSAEAARILGAEAFTIGSDVYFGANKFDPASSSGLALIAHELTHVAQQAGPARLERVTGPGTADMEDEARNVATLVMEDRQGPAVVIENLDRVFDLDLDSDLPIEERLDTLSRLALARAIADLTARSELPKADVALVDVSLDLDLGNLGESAIVGQWASAISSAILGAAIGAGVAGSHSGAPTQIQRSPEPSPHPEPNRTGMPDQLKSGIESKSGVSMNDVRVHFNSPHPAQFGALAFAHGEDIYVGPGQEEHLPHEAWHVVQQKRGQVQPTRRHRGVRINDDPALESEADRFAEQRPLEEPAPSLDRRAVASPSLQPMLAMTNAPQLLPDEPGTNHFMQEILDRYLRGEYGDQGYEAIEADIYDRYGESGPPTVFPENEEGEGDDVFTGDSWVFSEKRSEVSSTHRMMLRFRSTPVIQVAAFIRSLMEVLDHVENVLSYKYCGNLRKLTNRIDPVLIYTSVDPNDPSLAAVHEFIAANAGVIDQTSLPFYQRQAGGFYKGSQPTEQQKAEGIESFGSVFSSAMAQVLLGFPHLEYQPNLQDFRETVQLKAQPAIQAKLEAPDESRKEAAGGLRWLDRDERLFTAKEITEMLASLANAAAFANRYFGAADPSTVFVRDAPVYVQNPTMRGDMHDIAVALSLQPHARVVLYLDEWEGLSQAFEILDFYTPYRDRVFVTATYEEAVRLIKEAKATASDMPAATGVIMNEGKKDQQKVKEVARFAMAGSYDPEKYQIALIERGFRPGVPYLIVNYRDSGHPKSGKAVHPEFDTGVDGFKQLLRIADKLGFVPVPMGEPPDLGWNGPDLIKYFTWDCCKPTKEQNRRQAEYGLLAHLADNFNVRAMAMRSGVTDMLAFVGIDTISIDISTTISGEEANEIAMSDEQAWKKKISGWMRVAKRRYAVPDTLHLAFFNDLRRDTREAKPWSGEFSREDERKLERAVETYFGSLEKGLRRGVIEPEEPIKNAPELFPGEELEIASISKGQRKPKPVFVKPLGATTESESEKAERRKRDQELKKQQKQDRINKSTKKVGVLETSPVIESSSKKKTGEGVEEGVSLTPLVIEETITQPVIEPLERIDQPLGATETGGLTSQSSSEDKPLTKKVSVEREHTPQQRSKKKLPSLKTSDTGETNLNLGKQEKLAQVSKGKAVKVPLVESSRHERYERLVRQVRMAQDYTARDIEELLRREKLLGQEIENFTVSDKPLPKLEPEPKVEHGQEGERLKNELAKAKREREALVDSLPDLHLLAKKLTSLSESPPDEELEFTLRTIETEFAHLSRRARG